MPPGNELDFSIVHGHRAVTGESPVWDAARGVLWWIDIQGHLLVGNHLASGRCIRHVLPTMPGLVALASDGQLILGLEDGLWHFSPERASATCLCPLPIGDGELRVNDGKADNAGHLWFGLIDKSGSGRTIGALCRRDTDGRVSIVREGLTIPNSIAVSPAGDRLYYSDTATGRLFASPLDQNTGDLGEDSCLAQFAGEGRPDGLSVDTMGNLWLALIGGGQILKIAPCGTVLQKISTPFSRPTMIAFCGEKLNRIAITSQRRLLSFAGLTLEPEAGNLMIAGINASGLRPFRVGLR